MTRIEGQVDDLTFGTRDSQTVFVQKLEVLRQAIMQNNRAAGTDAEAMLAVTNHGKDRGILTPSAILAPSKGMVTTVAGEGKVFEICEGADLVTIGWAPLQADFVYRSEWRARLIRDATGGASIGLTTGIAVYDAEGRYLGEVATVPQETAWTVAGGWKLYSTGVTGADARLAFPAAAYLRASFTRTGDACAVTQISRAWIGRPASSDGEAQQYAELAEAFAAAADASKTAAQLAEANVDAVRLLVELAKTQAQEAALDSATSASASLTSEQLAATYVTQAGAFAGAAEIEKIAAEVANSTAQAAATSAETSAVTASSQAASATQSASLSAHYSTNRLAGNLVPKSHFRDALATGWETPLLNVGQDPSFADNPGFPYFGRFNQRDNLAFSLANLPRRDWGGRKVRVRATMSAVESNGAPIGFGFIAYDKNDAILQYAIEQVQTTAGWFAVDYTLTLPAGTMGINPWVWVDKVPGNPGNALVAFAEITDVTAVFDLTASVNTSAAAIANLEGSYATLENTVTAQGASVTENATAISTLEGRTEAYWEVTAVAGTGRAQLTVKADANGGGGVDIIGNVRVVGIITATAFITDQGVDLPAIVPGALNWRAAYVDATDLGPGNAYDTGIVAISATGACTTSTVVTITEVIQSGWASAAIGYDTNADTVIDYYNSWISVFEFFYRINGGAWINTGITQVYNHELPQGTFLWNSLPSPSNKFSPNAAGTLQLGVRWYGSHEEPTGTGAIYDREARFEIVNWK